MRPTIALLASLALLRCAAPAAVRAPARCPAPVAASPAVPRAQAPIEWVSLEPTHAGDPERWTVRLGDLRDRVTLRADERGEPDCRGPLAREGADGRWWCMRVDSDLVWRGQLSLNSAAPSATFDLRWRRADTTSGPPAALPPGRYRLSLRARSERADAPWREVRRFFSIASTADARGEGLLRRAIAEQSRACPPAPAHVFRALSRSMTPAQLAPLLASPGATTDDRVAAITAMIELPEVRAWLRDEVSHSRASFSASCAILQSRSMFDHDARAQAEGVFAAQLASEADIGVSAIYAAHQSSWSPSIVRALAARIQRTRDVGELSHWPSVFTCPSLQPSESAGLGALVRALRDAANRVRREHRDVAASLDARATELRAALAHIRANNDAELRHANGGRPPSAPRVDGDGCGFGFGTSGRFASTCSRERWPSPDELTVATGLMTLEPSATPAR